MKQSIVLLLFVFTLLSAVACGGAAPGGATPGSATPDNGTNLQTSQDSTGSQMAATETLPATEISEVAPDPDTTQSVTGECEDFFRFCVTATLSGAVETSATAGMGGQVDNCEAWVAAGDPRILDIPMMQNAGEDLITVALARIAEYTGPGVYELQGVVTEGIPDSFPTIAAAGRTFSNGEGSTAVVTINPDGSGTVEATGLVEVASIQVSSPDPDARVDFNMQWTCREN